MKLVIFDLDDTLIDFASTRVVAYDALAELLEREGLDAAGYMKACAAMDKPLFKQFEQGLLTRQEYRLRRFSDPFAAIGLEAVPELVQRLNKLFMDVVNDSPRVYDDVHAVLGALRERDVRTAILTNGPSDGQRRKLKATGLGDMVDFIAIGEEVGFSKPLPQAFHNVVGKFSLGNEHALMVGDSPELDYDAALNAGLKALLLDRDGLYRESGRAAIASLLDVLGR